MCELFIYRPCIAAALNKHINTWTHSLSFFFMKLTMCKNDTLHHVILGPMLLLHPGISQCIGQFSSVRPIEPEGFLLGTLVF